ncbi:MAG: Fic family protein [Cytophagales bacterium]|nr:Fic family protein [Cytophagales bacterium]
MQYKLYTSIHQFEPLLPSEFKQGDLLSKAHDVMRAATELVAQPVPDELRELLRGMNAYYTNRIEGQHTRPLEIEQALRKDFSHDAVIANKQKLALRHMLAEREVERHLAAQALSGVALTGVQLYSAELLCYLHHQLFAADDGDGAATATATATAGVFRQQEVQVGQHVAPTVKSLPLFLSRWTEYYGGVRRGEAALLAALAAHQRLGWIHPFADGNGRVMRLHTHTMLFAQGLTRGLWSPLRGFARTVDRYYELLARADEPRRGDLDGRGNLSESALIAWMDYALDLCLDQIQLMRGLLKLSTMEQRMAAALSFEQHTLRSGVRMEAIRPLHYLWLGGHSLSRGEFKAMMGLGDRIATDVLTALVQRGLLKSDTPQGAVRFGIPLHALRFYFPSLWPEAEADVAAELA